MRTLIPEQELKEFLDFKVNQFNKPSFIEGDPVSIPHRFARQEDIEIAAFIAATLAWGQRNVAIDKANELINRMDGQPWQFIMEAGKQDFRLFRNFVHRTFNGDDCVFFLRSLQRLYKKYGNLEQLFSEYYKITENIKEVLIAFRTEFLALSHSEHVTKHIAHVGENASAKRLNLFLRWMVRKDKNGVDFGLWKDIPPSSLYIPLDLHTGNVARNLGLLSRKQNDWRAVEELTKILRKLDPEDPVKYDYALFGLGIFEKFSG